MTFRLRVIGVLVFVAVAATAATAWLTWRQATGAVERTVTAGREETARITDRLREYGYAHGTWERVPAVVDELSRETGQRIRVIAAGDDLVADSDVLAGRAPRPGSGQPPVLVDPLPRLRMPAEGAPAGWLKPTVVAIRDYRATAVYAACLTRAGAVVTARPDGSGIPLVSTDLRPADCRRDVPKGRPPQADLLAVRRCEDESRERAPACLQRAFRERTRGVTPPRLEVHLGVRDESPPALAAAPTVGVAAGVALAVALAALLLSRAVLRPVRALTVATRSLGEGDLARRVPVTGRDEIAELGRAFNRMAGSIQGAEERQRRLTGDIAHELRTPLANLRGYVEALQDGYVEPTPELLDSLHEEVMLQQRIVDDLQDLALAEAGALTYHRVDVDLRELLETCRTAHHARAEAATVTLTTAPPATPVLVHADPDRLRQVVGNLLTNAIRATPPGGTVTLALVPHGELAIIHVHDTGTGISEDALPHLFDRFWRADAARGRQTGG
ncbi:sensor histidine kinase, partial [Streptomyces clavuligerus]